MAATKKTAVKRTARKTTTKRCLGSASGRAPRVKSLSAADGRRFGISEYPHFSVTGSVTGMRKLYYGKMALLVRCGSYIYNVTTAPEIYEAAK